MSQDVTDCPRCARCTPAARGECIYCGEPLPFTRIHSTPQQRNIDRLERAFNTVLEPVQSSPGESVVAALAAALRIEQAEARSLGDSAKPIPLARTQTQQEAEMIAALVRTCGLRATVVADDELRIDTELLRARRLTVTEGQLRVHHASGDLILSAGDIKLMVIGVLKMSRVDYTERASLGDSANVVDTSEYGADEAMLDVYTSTLDRSFRIKSDSFDYSGLVNPMSFRAQANFKSAVAALSAAATDAMVDDEFARVRSLLARAWPERTSSEARGVKRSGISLRAVAHSTIRTDNRDQFERYSRLMFLWLVGKRAIQAERVGVLAPAGG